MNNLSESLQVICKILQEDRLSYEYLKNKNKSVTCLLSFHQLSHTNMLWRVILRTALIWKITVSPRKAWSPKTGDLWWQVSLCWNGPHHKFGLWCLSRQVASDGSGLSSPERDHCIENNPDTKIAFYLILMPFLENNQYSGTCLERPPQWAQKYGLSRQVVFGDRFNYIEM